MQKTAQQTSQQGTLVGENQAPDDDGRHLMDNPTNLAPGGSDTPQEDSGALSHGQESYPGLRPGDPNNQPGSNPPDAGDIDENSTNSAEETGQSGDTSDVDKKKAYNYS